MHDNLLVAIKMLLLTKSFAYSNLVGKVKKTLRGRTSETIQHHIHFAALILLSLVGLLLTSVTAREQRAGYWQFSLRLCDFTGVSPPGTC